MAYAFNEDKSKVDIYNDIFYVVSGSVQINGKSTTYITINLPSEKFGKYICLNVMQSDGNIPNLRSNQRYELNNSDTIIHYPEIRELLNVYENVIGAEINLRNNYSTEKEIKYRVVFLRVVE